MDKHKILGIMSGTSLDGLDLACCHLWEEEGKWKYEIREATSLPYTAEMQDKLKHSIHLPADELLIFHNRYGRWIGEQARSFISEQGIEIHALSSHGHTSHHQPGHGLTFQLGSGQHLANASRLLTVCDFRTNDLALGGQGAPLVPVGDRLFFTDYTFCLNLGGISNISFEKDGKRIAYDIGLANMILNHICRAHELPYDEGGRLGRKGTLNRPLLEQLNGLEYYALPYPKSTGYEWFLNKVIPLLSAHEDSLENLLRTAVQHICQMVAEAVQAHRDGKKCSMLVSGGGALNLFLLETLREKLGNQVELVVPARSLIEYKEALVFALMGTLRLLNRINVFSSVTGARRDSVSGVVYLPQ